METVCIVLNGKQCLKGGANIIEIDFLCVQTAATGLDVVLEFLRTFTCTVKVAHCYRPDPSCNTADDRIFSIESIAEEEGEIRCEFVDIHSSTSVIFYIGESVGER